MQESASSPASPAELVIRAGAGERAAEAELCRRFLPAVRAYARRRLRPRDVALEFEQDVLLLLIQALRERRVEQPERVGGFVLGICKNLALERARQAERRRELWDQYGAAVDEVVPAELTGPTYPSIHLEDCMSELSQRAREVVRLSYAEELSHDEIGRRLDISAENARVMRHRTLAALRDCLSKPLRWEAA